MLEGRAVVGDTDMSQGMQEYAMLCASEALDVYEVTDYEGIAHYIKKKFDDSYGLAWQCVVGFSFGSSITHLCGSFIYFHLEKLAFLLFKDVNVKDENSKIDQHIGIVCGDLSSTCI
eukprot:TRINITY_DN17501_c0_g1_i1.p1 TRINITY_DN17501_c0_g1~~TRINITY_DN17501_c0_g1_i1.p1  ORF type:complete len:117 (-),score=3.45 TRINITY_DN17501_c0_g1_i1:424-774(-)